MSAKFGLFLRIRPNQSLVERRLTKFSLARLLQSPGLWQTMPHVPIDISVLVTRLVVSPKFPLMASGVSTFVDNFVAVSGILKL